MNEDILEDVGEVPQESPLLSPQILAHQATIVRESFELGRDEFPEGCHLDYVSHYMNHAVNWKKVKSCVNLDNRYHHCIR